MGNDGAQNTAGNTQILDGKDTDGKIYNDAGNRAKLQFLEKAHSIAENAAVQDLAVGKNFYADQ